MNTKHVVSLPIAKRMKELGFSQSSSFYWINEHLCYHDTVSDGYYADSEIIYSGSMLDQFDVYAAHSVAELVDMLPSVVNIFALDENCEADEFVYRLFIHKDGDDEFVVRYEAVADDIHYTSKDIFFIDKKLCNAICEMLIHLAEQGIINPKE